MGRVSELAVSALAPYVGPVAADTCVRATAISAGKMADELDAGDISILEASIRRLLGPVATVQMIDGIVAEIRVGVGA